nr:MAG TPA: hypothetical protein [Caudoviricetes sp.]
MNGWMLRMRKKQNLRYLTVRDIPCMKPSRGNDRWKQL